MAQIDVSLWLKKIKEPLSLFLIFLSGTQLGHHFWPTSAFVYGIRIDYLSPTLYVLDLLIVLYLLINYKIGNLKIYALRLIIPLLLTNLIFSQNPWATLNWSFHFILIFSFIYLLNFYSHLPYVLFILLFFQLFLSLGQIILGHSLQGPFYYLGERMLSVGHPNVAVGSLFNTVVVRAYGTFSHPNILAGYSVLVLLIIHKLSHSKLLKISSLAIVIALIILTESRTAALSLFFIVIPFYFVKTLRLRTFYYLSLLIAAFSFSSGTFLTRALDLSLGQRLSLQQISNQIIAAYPIFGTGVNATITRYPDIAPSFRLLQPDHNSFTLLLSWFGVVGVLSLTSYLFQFKNLRIYDLRLLIPLLPLLLFDHYLLTSIQGIFILLLFLRVNYVYDIGSPTRC